MGLKKSSLIGKYGVIVNSFVVLLYFILLLISRPNDWGNNLVLVLFSVLYLFIVSLVIDLINIRNKKVQLSITTNKEHMASTLTSVFPHGATVTHAQGAFSGREEETIIMIVSSTEVNKAVSVAKKVDPNAFIIASPVNQVYGNFFIKPVE